MKFRIIKQYTYQHKSNNTYYYQDQRQGQQNNLEQNGPRQNGILEYNNVDQFIRFEDNDENQDRNQNEIKYQPNQKNLINENQQNQYGNNNYGYSNIPQKNVMVVQNKIPTYNTIGPRKVVINVVQSGNISPKVPNLNLPFWGLCLIILGLGIAIFSTQGDLTAIVVLEVIINLLNLGSAYYYYTKTILQIFTQIKPFRILFCIILLELFFAFISILISWINHYDYALQLVSIIFLVIFELFFYKLKRDFRKKNNQYNYQ